MLLQKRRSLYGDNMTGEDAGADVVDEAIGRVSSILAQWGDDKPQKAKVW